MIEVDNDSNFSPQESLKLIQSMINKSKLAYADNSFYFLFWGWLVFGCCISQFILIKVNYAHHYYVWLLMIVGGIISGWYSSKQAKQVVTKSFVDIANQNLWMALVLAFMVLLFINVTATKAWQNAFPYYILIYAIGTFVTGKLLQFKPLVYGGLINFVLSAVCSKFTYEYQLLILAAALLCSYIIPGHLLKIQYKKQG